MHYIESPRMGHVSGSFDRPRSFHTWDGLPTSQTIHTVVIEESETWVYRQPPGIIPTVAILTMAIGSLGPGNRLLLCVMVRLFGFDKFCRNNRPTCRNSTVRIARQNQELLVGGFCVLAFSSFGFGSDINIFTYKLGR